MVVVGAGGHARSVVATALDNSISIEGVYDDTFGDSNWVQEVLGVPLLGMISDTPSNIPAIVAIGDNITRERLFIQRTWGGENSLSISSLISKSSVIPHESTEIAEGTCVLALAYIGPHTHVGRGCIVNTGAIIEHDVSIGDFCHISIRATIAGYVTIGRRCFVGAGATVIDKVSICDDVIIGAGAVVTASIHESGTYVGCPAHKISEKTIK
jgi:sugar O-acyltransferase (sialic acid O-acetyltransferase NeuD family)